MNDETRAVVVKVANALTSIALNIAVSDEEPDPDKLVSLINAEALRLFALLYKDQP